MSHHSLTINNTLAGVAQLVERVALITAKRSTSRSWVRAPPSAIPISKAHMSSCSFCFLFSLRPWVGSVCGLHAAEHRKSRRFVGREFIIRTVKRQTYRRPSFRSMVGIFMLYRRATPLPDEVDSVTHAALERVESFHLHNIAVE